MNPATPLPTASARVTTRALPRTMKAVVKATAGPGAEIRDVPVPTCGAGDLLLRVLRAGVNAWGAPSNIPPEAAGVMEPLGNAVHTAFAGPIAACNRAVTGCGPIGLFAIAVAKAAGAARVFASDVSPYRLDLARRMNADAVIHSTRESLPERNRQLMGRRGLDGGVATSGHPQAL